jgi:hypothetical protein
VARSRFFYVRLTVLLTILAGVLMWAWADVRSRQARNRWDHTLDVIVVIVQLEPIEDKALEAFRSHVPELEERLATELSRYRPGAPRPFHFRILGPIEGQPAPPPIAKDSLVDEILQSIALSAYVKDVDKRAGVDKSLYDSRIYVTVRGAIQKERTLAEGRSEQGGRIGLVEVELDAASAELPAIVVGHELLHTLGATDKYDPRGQTMFPTGLAEPDRIPIFPQRFAEIMARNRPLSAFEERVPDGFDQIAVGATTAREIGWVH